MQGCKATEGPIQTILKIEIDLKTQKLNVDFRHNNEREQHFLIYFYFKIFISKDGS